MKKLKLICVLLVQLVAIIRHMSKDQVQALIGKPKRLGAELRQILLQSALGNELIDWQWFYREVFDLGFDPSTIIFPPERDGFGWVIVNLPGLTDNQVYDKCVSRFPSWRYYNDLDTAIAHNDRTAKDGPYAIRVRDGIEADQQHRNPSANEAIKCGIKGLTVRERMLQELWYHWKIGGHLDTKSGTICSGSRYGDGGIPCVESFDDRFGVGHVYPVRAIGYWGVREVIS
jgi:hypothetical protein